jgi:hypothetical protein
MTPNGFMLEQEVPEEKVKETIDELTDYGCSAFEISYVERNNVKVNSRY